MNSSQKSEEFYKKLRTQLYETTSWPSEYLYKFIVLTEGTGIKDVQDLFNGMGIFIEEPGEYRVDLEFLDNREFSEFEIKV